MHDNPERRALAQPSYDVAACAGGAGTSRLAHHAGAHDESHVRHEVVRCAHARKNTRRVKKLWELHMEKRHMRHRMQLRRAPADAPVTRIALPFHSATPNRMCAMSAVAGSAAKSYDRPRHTTLTMRVAAT